LFIDFDKNGLGYIFWAIFSQTHLVTLAAREKRSAHFPARTLPSRADDRPDPKS
jgi:hypothetical protein